jgi:hypothetical protein
MTDTLQVDSVTEEQDDYLSCGCCIRPPAAVEDKITQLETRREALDRRLRGLADAIV